MKNREFLDHMLDIFVRQKTFKRADLIRLYSLAGEQEAADSLSAAKDPDHEYEVRNYPRMSSLIALAREGCKPKATAYLDSLPAITQDEALELMTHHLQLARVYYQNVSDDTSLVAAEVQRLMHDDNASWALAEPWLAAAEVYYTKEDDD